MVEAVFLSSQKLFGVSEKKSFESSEHYVRRASFYRLHSHYTDL